MTSCPHVSACLSRRSFFAHLLLRMHLHVTLHCRDFLLTFCCPSVFLAIAPPRRSPTFSRSSTFSASNRTLSHHHPSLITYFCVPPCRLPHPAPLLRTPWPALIINARLCVTCRLYVCVPQIARRPRPTAAPTSACSDRCCASRDHACGSLLRVARRRL